MQYGPRPGKPGGYVHLDGQRIDIRAGVHQLGGFSVHADQKDFLNFVGRIPRPPKQVRIVLDDDGAKAALTSRIPVLGKSIEVLFP